jgi:hypothetical protein
MLKQTLDTLDQLNKFSTNTPNCNFSVGKDTNMSLYVFSTVLLSSIFLIVFNTWWVEGESFKIHLSVLMIGASTVLSSLLLIAIYPILKNRTFNNHNELNLDKSNWADDVSGNLSTPAAVIDGYNVHFANKAFLTEIGMLGLSDQILGMPLTNIIHPEDHQRLIKR